MSVNTKLRYTYWGESVEKGRYKQLGGKEAVSKVKERGEKYIGGAAL